jgi:hypothetical protein
MFVSIRVQGRLAQDPLREHLERRLRAAAQRLGGRVTGIALRAASAPGRRADGTTCRVAIALGEGTRVVTGTGRGANVYFAADAAIDRAVRATERALRGPDEGAPRRPRPDATGDSAA